MQTENFVKEDSIVREIWGKSDTILFIFAGASAEFALNKTVDWLYYTGKLPQDPLGRLFSTVSYAREIVFAKKESAIKAIQRINHIHGSVENNRGMNIPDWAYRDVLFMLIDYSIRAYELLERPLSIPEKKEVFQVFWEVGTRMNVRDLPVSYDSYAKMRNLHLEQHLFNGDYTQDLYKQYRKHLGMLRYRMLMETQIIICPKHVRQLLGLRRFSILSPVITGYKLSRFIHLDLLIKSLILPPNYKEEIRSLDYSAA
ncbi:oxygenase MpaB family protein [Christiangramia sp. SM2212]|uniref:Oxygenase MpaB family protein n=1 Tax=Christiangramia sediminicola TaxID=3073267 RepID=A0ABU1ERI4_9FLAO|nr:oxygenase MpaB family protein [Christiangramia sp. SM2212]MDR5591003.1 oxygenase MpaB family protein [Christiangramia sp. SM2212]